MSRRNGKPCPGSPSPRNDADGPAMGRAASNPRRRFAARWPAHPVRRSKQVIGALRGSPFAGDVAGALARGRFGAIVRMVRTLSQTPGESEKIVSRRFRYLWICNPKVASRSIMAALRSAEPDARVVFDKSVAEILSIHPEAKGYYSFSFIRHPFDRALSLYTEMRCFRERFEGRHRLLKAERQRNFDRSFFGLAEVDSFEDWCRWLNTAYGSDTFANGHFRSQHLQIRLADGRLPDFIGRLEHIDEDFGHVAARVGMPATELPKLNTMLGWQAPSPQALGAARAERSTLLTEPNKALLAKRYAADLKLYERVSASGRS